MIQHIAQRALSTLHTVQASHDIAAAAIRANVPGDLVECGVFAGAQAAAMALAARGTGRKVHLFDSFTGIPAGGARDLEWKHPEGTSACSIEAVKAHMREWGIADDDVVYQQGLFSETMGADLGPIAVLRLDGDLYESTRVCLNALYPKLSVGGWLIVDDFGLSGARAAVDEYFSKQYPPVYMQRHF